MAILQVLCTAAVSNAVKKVEMLAMILSGNVFKCVDAADVAVFAR